jgi:uncharacterized protein involved in exopolysaccharide biosynthesis
MQGDEVGKSVLGYFVPAAVVPVTDSFDWQSLLMRLKRGKWLVAGSTLLLATAFGFLAIFSVRMYRAETVVAIVEEDGAAISGGVSGQLGRLAGLAGLNIGGGSTNRLELLAFLSSRQLAATFIEREQLMPLLFPERWDSGAKAWRTNKVTGEPTMDEAVSRLRRNVLDIEQDAVSGMVNISVEHRDPAMAASLANAFVAAGNSEMRSRVSREATKGLEFLNRELSTTQNVEIRQAMYELVQRQLNSKMLTSVREEYAYKIVDPAIVPDAKRFVRPLPLVYVAIGAFFGAFLGCCLAVRRRKASS